MKPSGIQETLFPLVNKAQWKLRRDLYQARLQFQRLHKETHLLVEIWFLEVVLKTKSVLTESITADKFLSGDKTIEKF